MVVGFLLAAALMGPAADSSTVPVAPVQGVASPQAPASEPVKTAAAEASKDCSPTAPDPNSREVVVCVQKPQGFRIDPDVLAAKKAKREALRGRLKTPQEKLRDNSCSVVGAQGCIFAAPGINLLAAAATAAEISKRLAEGKEIGSIFVTEPQKDEYQYYQDAKKEREQKEAAAAVKAHTAAMTAKAAAAKAAAASGDASEGSQATP
jgi:hypothetical protein